MVTFNELRISEERSCLIVDCEIEDVDIYKNMYIKEILVEYYKDASAASMPDSKAYLLYENKNDDKSVRAKRVSMSEAHLRLAHFSTSSFTGGLFFVIVRCEGKLPANIVNYPCGYDETTKICVVLDWKSFYKRGMQYVSALYGSCNQRSFCEYPAGFEDFIILWNSLKLAINVCDWELVKNIWERILNMHEHVAGSGGGSVSVSGGCGCRK